MQCSQCGHPIHYATVDDQFQCQSCKHLFSQTEQAQLQHYFSLKRQLNHTLELKTQLQRQEDAVKQQLHQLSGNFNPAPLPEPLETPTPSPERNNSLPQTNQHQKNEISVSEAEIAALKQKISPPQFVDNFQSTLRNKLKESGFEKLMGFNLFLIIGVIFVLIGAAFFLGKVFKSGALGPFGKLSMIYFGALVTLGIGNMFRRKQWKDFGLIIMGLGVVLLYYATYAGFQQYLVIPQLLAFGLMVLITLFTSYLALLEDNKGLAILALCGGFSTPIMLSGRQPEFIALQIYLSILNLGFLSLAFKKQWNILYYLSFGFTYLLFIPTLPSEAGFFVAVLTFLNAYFVTYSIYPFFYYLKHAPKSDKPPPMGGHLSVVLLNTALACACNYYYLMDQNKAVESFALVTLSYAVLFLAMSSYLRKKPSQSGFHFMVGLAALFIVITIPVIFSKQLITILWFALVYIMFRISDRLAIKPLYLSAVILLGCLGLKLLIFDYPEVFHFDSFHIVPGFYDQFVSRWVTIAFALISSFGLAHYHQKSDLLQQTKQAWLYGSWGIFIALLFFISNIEVHAFAHDFIPDSGFVAISILWGLFAVGMIYTGLSQRLSALRKLGIALFFSTFVKIFFIDMAQLDVTFKFISFMVIGLFLIFTSYLYRKFKDEFSPEDALNEI